MGWEAAYEEKTGLWNFWKSMTGRTYARYFHEDAVRKGNPGASYYQDLDKVESAKMMLADPVWVEEDMFDIWAAAEEHFQPEPLMEHDLLMPFGFVYLPKPKSVLDARGFTLSYRAFSWGVSGIPNEDGQHPGINLSVYAHCDDPDDYAPQGVPVVHGQKLMLSHMTPWMFGRSITDLISHDQPDGIEFDQALNSWKQLWTGVQSLFRLMQQRISTHADVSAPRASRRRATRAGIEDRPVKVIKLRRPKSKPSEGEGKEVEWSHRWIVDLHWRNQWYPSLNQHRQILIAPYVKGPEEKELRVKPIRAFEVKQ